MVYQGALTDLERYGWNDRGVWWIANHKKWNVVPQPGGEREIIFAIDTFVHSLWCDMEFKKGDDETVFKAYHSLLGNFFLSEGLNLE